MSAEIITMPRLSDSMDEGTIVSWLRSDGERVEIGEDLVEIETDKATMTYEAELEGTLTIVADTGETLPVGAVIARVGDAASPVPLTRLAAVAPAPVTPVARRIAAAHSVSLDGIVGTGPRGRITRRDVEARRDGAAARTRTASPPARAPAAPPREPEQSARGR